MVGTPPLCGVRIARIFPMPIFATVFRALKEADAPFLVIGGHAVVLHGHLRNTFRNPNRSPALSNGKSA
jgi:hypothetical protein